ncbi:Peptidase C26 [Operophtera brumata]|uniref:Peptidase C26 n=1 Tax=Operophtera brumata TaxID=104452 RepID=A0A0L7KTV5_OPEBR|nr:Peptidase C26 [Operophtera brumata]
MQKIQPTFMKHLIGTLHIKKLLSTEETCIIKNLIDFIKQSKWNNYPETETDIQVSKNTFFRSRKIKRKMRYLTKKCTAWRSTEIVEEVENKCYPKMGSELDNDEEINRNQVVHTLFITLEAYLDAYSVQSVQETLGNLNEQLLHNETDVMIYNFLPNLSSYSVSEQFIKKYRSIYQMLKELVLLLQEIKNGEDLPDVLKVFEKIDLLM